MMQRRDVFQAIADPTRRAIIMMLALAPMTPNSIAVEFNTSRQAVSRHIKILSECDLVKQEQSGREIYYYLNERKMNEVEMWIEQFKKLIEKRFGQLDNVLTQLKKNRS
jgi:DNA-binding transcriptional ArsR family regulator